jgi:polysaccharide biosynthesis protein PslH
MARPVVSTSLGAEGLAVNHGQHVLIADDPGEFADQVARLLADGALRDALGREGRSLVEREYSWETAGGRLEAFYTQLLGGARRVA